MARRNGSECIECGGGGTVWSPLAPEKDRLLTENPPPQRVKVLTNALPQKRKQVIKIGKKKSTSIIGVSNLLPITEGGRIVPQARKKVVREDGVQNVVKRKREMRPL